MTPSRWSFGLEDRRRAAMVARRLGAIFISIAAAAVALHCPLIGVSSGRVLLRAAAVSARSRGGGCAACGSGRLHGVRPARRRERNPLEAKVAANKNEARARVSIITRCEMLHEGRAEEERIHGSFFSCGAGVVHTWVHFHSKTICPAWMDTFQHHCLLLPTLRAPLATAAPAIDSQTDKKEHV